ncbi:hypothetical protein [Haloarcula sebkhae]|uniref:Uncharacterized protein n=1 Tax=Haloarcula sebkhae TaxID=932660 RepID=A0ACC6VH07_9EURY|nr:hypothetical protein [Haloarcula sebkhae]
MTRVQIPLRAFLSNPTPQRGVSSPSDGEFEEKGICITQTRAQRAFARVQIPLRAFL